MLHTMWKVSLLAVALAACGKSKAECRTDAEAFGKLLAAADTSGSLIQLSHRMKLVERSDLTAKPTLAPVVNITATEISYQGTLIGDPEDLVERLAAAHAKIREELELGRYSPHDRPDPRSLLFVIDAETPWATIVGAVDAAARAGMTAPQFVFGAPVTWKSPPRAPVDDELDELMSDSSNQATRLAETTSRQVNTCASVTKLFGEVAMENGDKAQFLVQRLPAALIECNCDVDFPNFRSTMWRMLVNPHPVRVIAFDPDAPATPIAAPGTKVWREVAAQLAPGVRNGKLVVD